MSQKMIRTGLFLAAFLAAFAWLAQQAGASRYSDLSGSWAFQAVTEDSALGLVSGYPDGEFKPDEPVSHLESLVMLMKADGYNLDKQGAAGLNPGGLSGQGSVAAPQGSAPASNESSWGQAYVDQAIKLKLLPEDLAGSFNASTPASRAQVAGMLATMLLLPVSSQSQGAFTDLQDAPASYIPYINAVNQAGLMHGYGDGSFAPAKSVTRAEMGALIFQMTEQGWAKINASSRQSGWISVAPNAGGAGSSVTGAGGAGSFATVAGTAGGASGNQGAWLIQPSQTAAAGAAPVPAVSYMLDSLEGSKQITAAPDLVCFHGGKECSLNELLGDQVEVVFDSSDEAAYIADIAATPLQPEQETVRGSIKSIALGSDNYLILDDLLADDHIFPIAYDAVADGNGGKRQINFQSLSIGSYCDVYLKAGSVVRVSVLTTKSCSGTVSAWSSAGCILGRTALLPG